MPIYHPDDPQFSYLPMISNSKMVAAGNWYVFSVYLRSATDATVLLYLGDTYREITITDTLTRFKVAAYATGPILLMGLKAYPDSYSSLAIEMSWAKLEKGTESTAYASDTGGYTVDLAAGTVTFADAPANAASLTWDGSYDSTTTICEITTPWAVEDLDKLKWTQADDVMVFVHPDYPPTWLGRYGDNTWSITDFAYTNGPFEDINTVTAQKIKYHAGSNPYMEGVGYTFTAADLGKLVMVETSDWGTPWETNKAITAGNVRRYSGKFYTATTSATTGTTPPTHTDGTESDGAVSWAYSDDGVGVGKITAINTTSNYAYITVQKPFNASLGTTASHKWAFSPWSQANGYPSAVTWHKQRLCFGGSEKFPSYVWTSKTGLYKDFGTSLPLAEDDGKTFKLQSSQSNCIEAIASLKTMVCLTQGGSWAVDLDGTVPSAEIQGFRGVSSLQPLGVGNALIYAQSGKQFLRDLTFEWASQSYNGSNLCKLAPHMIEGYTLSEWCFQPSEDCIWITRSDGTLLGLTYMREEEVCGWHRHDTDGTFESICCVPENGNDAVYVTVLRGTARHIERFAQRLVTDVREGWFVDDGIQANGWNTTATTLTLTGGTNWDEHETLTATASAAIFAYPATTDVGDQLHYEATDGTIYRLTVEITASTTVATVRPDRVIPAAYRSARDDWGWARGSFSGAGHLEGETVSILADGAVVQDGAVVSGGAFTLAKPAVIVTAGLPYTQDLETLGLNAHGEGAIEKKRIVVGIRMMVNETWSVQVGKDEDHLIPAKTAVNIYEQPAELLGGLLEVRIANTWDKQGRAMIRNVNPLPVGIQAILPETVVGGV